MGEERETAPDEQHREQTPTEHTQSARPRPPMPNGFPTMLDDEDDVPAPAGPIL